MPYLFQESFLLRIANDAKDNEPFELCLIASDFTLEWKTKSELEALEAGYDGYARKELEDGTVSVLAADNKIMLGYDPQTFTPTGSGVEDEIYGYWAMTQDSLGYIVVLYKYPAPLILGTPAHSLVITPEWLVGTLPNP